MSAPKVRMAFPAGRPIQLRYTIPGTRREVRLSTGTTDVAAAEIEKSKLEARLLLGIPVEKKNSRMLGPDMLWCDFRKLYKDRKLSELRPRSRETDECRLDLATKAIQPLTLSDMASRENLVQLRAIRVAAGSPIYAKTFMASIYAALHWAEAEGLITAVPKIPRIKTAKIRKSKGRPIVGEEFDRMIEQVPVIVGEAAAPSYEHLLRGLWASALRVGEAMSVSWDIPGTIMPVWKKGRQPVLWIPAEMQKNDTEESIPLLPWFEKLLLKTPPRMRTGWVFNPCSLQGSVGRSPRHGRATSDWVATVIARIGKKAGIIVSTKGGKAKFASAHDLRRSCGERMLDAGVPEKVIARVMRHESWETTRQFYAPGSVQSDARLLREILAKADKRAAKAETVST